MSDYELRADSWQNWPAEFFDREDPAPDEQFYMEPRKVVHIVLLLASDVSGADDLVAANNIAADVDLFGVDFHATGLVLECVAHNSNRHPSDENKPSAARYASHARPEM